MAKPFRFRYVNELVGGFVLLVLVLLIAGVILAGHYQGWFTPVHKFKVSFPSEGSRGLKKGSEIEILGYVVGRIEKIDIDQGGRIQGEIMISGNWSRFIRQDSRAKIAKRFVVTGDAYITISQGTEALLADGSELTLEIDDDLIENVKKSFDEISAQVSGLATTVLITVRNYGDLAADLRSTNGPLMKTASNIEQITANLKSDEGALMKTLANVEKVTAGLKDGEGTAGKILRDPATINQVHDILGQVSNSILRLQGIIDDVKQTTVKVPPMATKVNRELDDLPGTVLQVQETLRQTQRLIEGIQKMWPIRSNVPQPEPVELIPTSDVAAPAAAGGKSP